MKLAGSVVVTKQSREVHCPLILIFSSGIQFKFSLSQFQDFDPSFTVIVPTITGEDGKSEVRYPHLNHTVC